MSLPEFVEAYLPSKAARWLVGSSTVVLPAIWNLDAGLAKIGIDLTVLATPASRSIAVLLVLCMGLLFVFVLCAHSYLNSIKTMMPITEANELKRQLLEMHENAAKSCAKPLPDRDTNWIV